MYRIGLPHYKTTGYKIPGKKITIIWLLADLRKEGSAYDLHWLYRVFLAASNQIKSENN